MRSHDRFRAALRLVPDSGAPGRARDFLTTTCLGWGVPQFVEAGGLVVSELVTNAVRHAGTEIRLTLTLARMTLSEMTATLTVVVHDRGDGVPHIVPPDQRFVGGRGLAMVAKVAEAWGVDAAGGGGKAVWCRLEAEAPVGPGDGQKVDSLSDGPR